MARPTLVEMIHVIDALTDISSDWYTLGLRLGVSSGRLNSIKANYHHDVDKCLMGMIEKWLDMFPDVGWKDVVVALNAMDKNDVAIEVARKYCKDAESLVTLPPPVPVQSEYIHTYMYISCYHNFIRSC